MLESAERNIVSTQHVKGWGKRKSANLGHVLKGAQNVDWSTYAGTTKALSDCQALEPIPIMEHVWERTNRELVNGELQRGQG